MPVAFFSLRGTIFRAFFYLALGISFQSAEAVPSALSPARVEEIAGWLPPQPGSPAPSFDHRAVWDKLAENEGFRKKVVERAGRMLTEPVPAVTDAQWDEALRTKDRKYDKVLDLRRFRLATFMLAEGMENQGRFLPAILKEIETICAERSWIIPAHAEFTGSNDLGSAMTAWSLATARAMLGDRMPDAQRQVVKDQIVRRVIAPYLEQIRDPSKKPDWWRYDGNNWNAVVHAGIVGAALAVLDSPRERAEVLAATELEVPIYLTGFPADGYSHEGMGYWKYGFGHYILLAETVYAATGGRLDFLQNPAARKIAEFPLRFEIAPGIYPAFADCPLNDEPPSWLFDILGTRFGIGAPSSRTLALDGTFFNMLYAWGVNLGFDTPPAASGPRTPALRDWFEESQIFVARSAPGTAPALGVAIKGGNNGLPHSHNDLGQFVITLNGKLVLTDPGVTEYNALTMGPRRYENQVINSYGHAVPVINGKLQGNGPAFRAQVVETAFTDQADRVTLSLRGGYNLFALDTLTRTLTFDREAPFVTVTDRMTADRPLMFATALTTYGEVKEESPGVWIITKDGQSLRVRIDAGGEAFSVLPETLTDKSRAGVVKRLGIALDQPVQKVIVTTTITPVL